MSQSIDEKCECPKGNKRCDLMRFVDIYKCYGIKKTIIQICMSNKPQEYSYLSDFPVIGLEKVCRRNLYNKIGKVNLE